MTMITKKTYLLLTSLLTLLFSACNNNSPSVYCSADYVPTEDVTIFDFKDIDFDAIVNGKQGEFKFSELYSNVKYIKLEATEQSTLGEIYKMEVLPNGDFIVFDKSHQILARFNSIGHFLNNIGNIGKAKNEYVKISDFMYDPFTDQIVIVDAHCRALKFYSLHGEYVSGIKFDKMFHCFGIIDEERIAILMNHLDWPQKNELSYNLLVYDRKGSLLAKYEPYTKDQYKLIFDSRETFKFQNKKLIGNELYLPVVFTFEKEKIVPLYYLDFGDKQLPIDYYKTAEIVDFRKNYDRSKIAYCKKFYETDSNFILNIVYGSKNLLYIKNKKNPDAAAIIKNIGINDLNGKIGDFGFDYFHKNNIYAIIEPWIIQSQYDMYQEHTSLYEEERGTVTPEDIEIMKDLMNHNNPIIQVCTLKD